MKVTFSHSTYQNLLLSSLIVSGAVKPMLDYFDAPLDVTLLILLAISLDSVFCLFAKKRLSLGNVQALYIIGVLVFYLLAAISLFYSASKNYGYIKLFLMIIPLVGFLYPLFIKEIKLDILYKMVLYTIIPVSIWFVFYRFLWSANFASLDFLINKARFGPLRHDYLNLGYLLGILILLSVKYSKQTFNVTAISIFLMLGLGSRGALIFTIICLLAYYYKAIIQWLGPVSVQRKTINKIVLFSTPLLLLLMIYYNKAMLFVNNGLVRFSSLIDFSTDSSSLERIDQYSVALEKGFSIQGMTVGYGLGSWGFLYNGIDDKGYPHNIFLEAWVELGFMAALYLMFFFCVPFLLKRPILFKSLALFALLNAMKSSSFAYDRSLFIVFGILIFFGFDSKKADKKIF